MSISAIILMNLGAAAILAALLATVMLAPKRLHRHFAAGHTHRQKAALRRQLWAREAKGPHPRRSPGRGLRPISD
jgi:uncharacterized membrane-anchored protein